MTSNKLVLILLLFFCSFQSKGQILLSILFGDKLNSDEMTFGMHFDYSGNRMTAINSDKAMRSFNFGLFLCYHFNDHWHLNADMLAKYKRGADKIPVYALSSDTLNDLFANGHVLREIRYLGLPLSMEYMFDFGGYVELGPQVSFRTKAKDVFMSGQPEGNLQLERDIRDEVSRWDFGWLAGIGYRFGKSKVISIGMRYQAGFSDVMKNMEGSQQHRQIGFYCNFPVGKVKTDNSKKDAE